MFQRFVYTLILTAAVGVQAQASSPVSERSLQEHLNDTLPARWTYMPEKQQEVPSGNDGWWRNLGDATLDSLIDLGIDHNYNLAMAMRRTAPPWRATACCRPGAAGCPP